jgi:tRNA(Ile)-lysidine synthase
MANKAPSTALGRTLRRALEAQREGSLCVAFSGGPDSTALLHALAQLPAARSRGLRAVHVDHGLHADSRDWADHCRQMCDALDVALEIHRVRIDEQRGTGIEAAARTARLAAFGQTLHVGEYLLTAHHREDQAETVLLKLLRGAGPTGLGGMREWRRLAAGWLWRPLLDTPRAVLRDYLSAHALDVIDDPSNRSPELARSFLRQDILPRLAVHWPQATRAISHAARLSREAADYLDRRTGELLHTLQRDSDGSLDARAWRALDPALRGPLLDQWLHGKGLAAPTLAQRAQLRKQIPHARGGRVPLVTWPGTAVHIWRGRLHAHPPLPEVPGGWQATWHGESLPLPALGGTLELTGDGTARTDASVPMLCVSLGNTGVRLRPAGDWHTRELRDLFQQAGIPPWRRRRCPLIHDHCGQLLAVADLWHTRAGDELFTRLGRRPRWSPAV